MTQNRSLPPATSNLSLVAAAAGVPGGLAGAALTGATGIALPPGEALEPLGARQPLALPPLPTVGGPWKASASLVLVSLSLALRGAVA
jgi:hypothetical protein